MTAAKLAGMIAGAAAAVSAFSMSAYAAPVQLTPSQTLALYGDTLNVEYYAGNNATPENIEFHYAGTTLELLSDEQYQDGIRNPFSAIYNDTSGLNSLSSWKNGAPALIYRYGMTVDNWNEWHGDDGRANLTLNTSLTIPNIKNIKQKIWWSAKIQPDSTPQTPRAWGDTRNSWGYVDAGVLGRIKQDAMTNEAFSVYNRSYTIGTLEMWNHNNPVPAYDLIPFYGIQINIPAATPYDTQFDYNGADFHINSVNAYDTGYYPVLGYSVFLMIQCPEIDGEFVGPTMPPTTTAATTTRLKEPETAATYTTAVTIDNFADDIQEIIRNQRWQIYQQEIMIRNQQVQNNTLRDILDRLDAIYVKMVRDNDIPISTDSPMWQEMAGALTGMTTFTMPNNILQGLTFWADCSNELMTRFDWLVPLAAFSLTMLVIYYVLFKGRTS